jgi:hypothetical protein
MVALYKILEKMISKVYKRKMKREGVRKEERHNCSLTAYSPIQNFTLTFLMNDVYFKYLTSPRISARDCIGNNAVY